MRGHDLTGGPRVYKSLPVERRFPQCRHQMKCSNRLKNTCFRSICGSVSMHFELRTIYHIEEICPPKRMRLIRACFDALAENKAGVDLGQVFDPYRKRRRSIERLPPGVARSAFPRCQL